MIQSGDLVAYGPLVTGSVQQLLGAATQKSLVPYRPTAPPGSLSWSSFKKAA